MRFGVLAVLIVIMSAGCGQAQMYMTPSTMMRDSVQITDEKIREAFEARPQLTRPLKLAIYNAGPFRVGLADSVRAIEDVQSVYEISPVLIEEDQYYRRNLSDWSPYRRPPTAPLPRLRYLAAQGHADLLMFVSASHRYDTDSNWLVSTYALLLPALFVPAQDATIMTDVSVFFVDVRNGFLYASYYDRTETENRYVRISYRENGAKDVAKQHIESLLPGVVDAVEKTIDTERFFLSSPSE